MHHWISGGGGEARVFVACKLFFTSERKQFFFWRLRSDNFFLCFVEEICCRMFSLLCTLPFCVFSGQHIFYQFRKQTSFFCPHFQQTFFLIFVATNYFFQFFSSLTPPPPTPDIKWCVPYHSVYLLVKGVIYAYLPTTTYHLDFTLNRE